MDTGAWVGATYASSQCKRLSNGEDGSKLSTPNILYAWVRPLPTLRAGLRETLRPFELWLQR